MEKKSVVLCDSNILIEFYKNNDPIVSELRLIGQSNIAISVVTAGELFYGALNKKERNQLNKDFSNLLLFHVTREVSECCYDLMQTYCLSHRLSLPDAFIAATSIIESIPLFTLNQKDFKFIKGINLYVPESFRLLTK